jgi:hypothetical protein
VLLLVALLLLLLMLLLSPSIVAVMMVVMVVPGMMLPSQTQAAPRLPRAPPSWKKEGWVLVEAAGETEHVGAHNDDASRVLCVSVGC